MINVKELRLGKYVIPNTDNIPWRVSAIARNYVYVELMTEITKGETEINPIPLDDEIMERLGFNSKWVRGVFGVATTSEHSDYVFYQKCEENGIAYFPKPLKYVHELQNMYYALTGEELKINEI